MGNKASKAQKVVRHYPPPSNVARPSHVPPPSPRAPFPPPSRPNHPADMAAKLGGKCDSRQEANSSGTPSGFDAQLAKRLQQIGPVSVQHPELKPTKPVSPRTQSPKFKVQNEMSTILENRSRISQSLQKESEQGAGLKQHASITTVKDIVRSLQKGRDPVRTSRDFGVDLGVVKKLEGIYAVPVDNSDGIVCS
jgi:hypothetical protein